MSEENLDSEVTIEELHVEAGAEAQIEEEVKAASEESQEVLAPEPSVEDVSGHKIKVGIKSLDFRPRGKAGAYRAGGAYVLAAAEAKELIDAGIATVLEDPCTEEITFPTLDPKDR